MASFSSPFGLSLPRSKGRARESRANEGKQIQRDKKLHSQIGPAESGPFWPGLVVLAEEGVWTLLTS